MIANCPYCKEQTQFSKVNENKYKCQKCTRVFHKCATDSCVNMIQAGIWCRDCTGWS